MGFWRKKGGTENQKADGKDGYKNDDFEIITLKFTVGKQKFIKAVLKTKTWQQV